MKSVVFFQNDVFDPRSLHRQTYVRAITADETVHLAHDAVGVVITVTHDGEKHVIRVPWDNVRQTLNVPAVDAKRAR